MMDLGMPTLIELPEPEDCAELCRELGLQFVELNMNLPQYQTNQINRERLEKISTDYQIYFTLHLDENLNPCDFNPSIAQAYRHTTTEAIQTAKALNMPILNMHLSGGVYFTLPEKKVFLFDVYRERYLENMRLFRDRCAAEIGEDPIRICIENSGGFTDFHMEAIDLLLESPVFGLTYDIGHNYSIGGTDEPAILKRQERLTHFHFHDAQGKKNHLPLGTGEIDIRKYCCLAKNHHGRIVLETKTVQGLRQSAEWFRAHFPDS